MLFCKVKILQRRMGGDVYGQSFREKEAKKLGAGKKVDEGWTFSGVNSQSVMKWLHSRQ